MTRGCVDTSSLSWCGRGRCGGSRSRWPPAARAPPGGGRAPPRGGRSPAWDTCTGSAPAPRSTGRPRTRGTDSGQDTARCTWVTQGYALWSQGLCLTHLIFNASYSAIAVSVYSLGSRWHGLVETNVREAVPGATIVLLNGWTPALYK